MGTNQHPYKPYYAEGKTIGEHRAIMEKHLGRKLDKNEVIHHIDGDPSNNLLDNLCLLSRSQHSKLHISGQQNWRHNFNGSSNGQSRLTEQAAKEIRRRYDLGEHETILASEFGISRRTVRRIGKREGWTHI